MTQAPTPPPLPPDRTAPAPRPFRRRRRGLVPLITLSALGLLAGAIVLADYFHEQRQYERAEVLLQRQEFRRAERIFRRWLSEEPDNIDARLGLARSLAGRSAWTEAVPAFRAVLALEADHPAAHFGLGRCLFKLGQRPEALERLTRAVELGDAGGEPRAEALFLLGELLHGEQRHIEAEAALRRVVALVEKTGRVDPAAAHARLGRVIHEQGRTEEALAYLDGALARYPHAAPVHFQLGEVHRERGAAATAAGAYRTARELGLKDYPTEFGLALALRDSGETSEAIRSLELVTRTHERQAEPWFALGRMREESDDRASALVCYERCLALEREHPGAKAGVLRVRRTEDR